MVAPVVDRAWWEFLGHWGAPLEGAGGCFLLGDGSIFVRPISVPPPLSPAPTPEAKAIESLGHQLEAPNHTPNQSFVS